MTRRETKCCLAVALTALMLAPVAASAREASKIRLFFEKVAGGNERGMLRSDLSPGSAMLQVKVTHLAPNTEHILYGDGVEVARFTTNAAGNGELRLNLFQTGGGTTPTFDPRGKFVTVGDGTNDVLAAWVYADPANDPPRPRINEETSLARQAAAQGSVAARYDVLPSGGARLAIALRGAVPGNYDVLVDGALVASLTTNPSGFAMLDLRVGPGAAAGHGTGNGNPNKSPHQRGQLSGNPRDAEIEISQAGVVQFAGEMRAQIAGLGVCTASSASSNLTPDPAQTTGTGMATLGVEVSCDRHLTLALTGLAAGDYDLLVAGVDVGDVAIPDAGAGTGSATLEFDDSPNAAAGELAMPAGVASGATIAIQEKPPLGTDVVMSGTLP